MQLMKVGDKNGIQKMDLEGGNKGFGIQPGKIQVCFSIR